MVSNEMTIPDWQGLAKTIRRWVARMSRPTRSLRLCESLSLGEKRLVAVVQFEGGRYLLGATAASVTLLHALPGSPDERQPGQGREETCEA
jgi:flagellar biogenesis protein FliO